MFKIGLVQNISEMRNYSYADYRRKLKQMDFEIVTYTRENIHKLKNHLSEIDCVCFASNSLNDSVVYECVCEEEFVKAFSDYLDKSGSTIVLHQNSLAGKENPYPFLGIGTNYKVNKQYASSSMNLRMGANSIKSVFKFPKQVSIENIVDNCLNNKSLTGLYWTLNELDVADSWIPVIVDSLNNNVVVKNSNKKIILSSLLLDYQNHFDFFNNLLINLIVDNLTLAIIEEKESDSIGFNYFLNSLNIKKLYYKKYGTSKADMDCLSENIALGVHSTILVSADITSKIPAELIAKTNEYGVKLIEINDDDEFENSDSFVVHTVDKNICLDFSDIELRIQNELEKGLISNSFLKTVDALTKLVEFQNQGLTSAKYDKEKIHKVFENVSKHISTNGSFDNTFGATCKMLWLFIQFLGPTDKLTKATYKWISEQSSFSSIREKLEYYLAISLLKDKPQEYLATNCTDDIKELIDNNFDTISEYDFLTVLQVTIIIANEDILTKLVKYIETHTNNGELCDSFVTAKTASFLIKMDGLVNDSDQREIIQKLLFQMIVYLKNVRQYSTRVSLEEELEIICALYSFELVVSFPVTDLTDLIFRTGNFPKIFRNYESTIDSVQKLRLEKEKIEIDYKQIKKDNNRLEIYRKILFASIILIVCLAYLLIYSSIILDEKGFNVFTEIIKGLKKTWPSLFTVLVIPFATFVIDRYLKKKKK